MLSVSNYRELYEGITQQDSSFRDSLRALADDLPDVLLSELELAQNRLNHAMLGIHPLYHREVELSGIVDYPERALRLFAEKGEDVLPFSELDPAYVQFLESQKRIYNVKERLPLSSVALKASNQWLSEEGVEVPDISATCMHLPDRPFSYSRKQLETAFARSMVLMNHLQNEIEKHGLADIYGANRSDLIQYCQSNSFCFQFDHSVTELTEAAICASGMDNLSNQ